MRLIKKIEKRLKIGYKTKRYLISLISLLYAYNAGKIKTNVYNNTVIFLLSIFLKNKINPTGANIMKDGIKDHPKNLVKPVTPCEKNSGKVLWSTAVVVDEVFTIYFAPPITEVNPSEPVASYLRYAIGKSIKITMHGNMILYYYFIFYYLFKNNLNIFSINKPDLSFYLFWAGFMTLIPLFWYTKGFYLIGIGPASMIFFLTPTAQFFLGVIYYDEPLVLHKLISFIFIWIAVIIYLNELRKE